MRKAVTDPIMSASGNMSARAIARRIAVPLKCGPIKSRPVPVGERASEIEPHGTGDPVAVADDDGPVEPDCLPKLGEGVSGQLAAPAQGSPLPRRPAADRR